MDTNLYIGLDLEGQHLRAALCDAEGQILAQRRQAIAKTQDDLLGQFVSLVQELHEVDGDEGTVAGVGIGVPGLVNTQTGAIELWPGYAGLTTVAVHEAIFSRTGVPAVVDDHSNTAAYGEWLRGVGRGFRHILYVNLGYNIGTSLILDGRMWRGATGFAGEVGFTTLDVDEDRTLSNTVSGFSVVRRIQDRLLRDRTSSLSRVAVPRDREMNFEDVIASALAGDELAQVVIERTGLFLGIGLSGMINLLNPELVVIGGTGMQAGDMLLKPTIAETERRAFPMAFKHCRIVAGQLGMNAGPVGAAMLARDSLV